MIENSLSLLFQAPNALMVDTKIKKLILNFKLTLLEQLEKVLIAFFIEKDFTKFDPHVGENSCQIRACQLLDLFDILPEDKFYKKTVIKRIKNIQLTINQVKNTLLSLEKNVVIKRYQPFQKNSHLTLADFLEINQCTCELAEYEIFLFHAYILSCYKKVNGLGDTCLDYPRMQDELKLSKTMAEKMVHIYQLRLSDWSCKFVKQRFMLQHNSENMPNILNKLEFLDDDGRNVLPLFLITQILVEDLINKKKSVMIFVERRHGIHFMDNICMLFVSNGKDLVYHELNDETDPLVLNQPCLFIFGTVVYQTLFEAESKLNYIIRLNKVGIFDALMANMAIHPQYSGHKLLKYKDNPYRLLLKQETHGDVVEKLAHRFNQKREIAIKYGCSKNNIDLLFIRHILCDSPVNQLKAI